VLSFHAITVVSGSHDYLVFAGVIIADFQTC